MSKRSWLAAIAFGITAAFGVLAQEMAPDQDILPPAAREQPAEQPAIEAEPVAPAVVPTDPPAEEHDSSSSENATENVGDHLYWGDGLAQWAMAGTGIVALFISGWAVWLVNRTLRTSQDAVFQATRAADGAISAVKEARIANGLADEANTETRRIGNAQIRSYVSVRA